jgi:hypothetical protein
VCEVDVGKAAAHRPIVLSDDEKALRLPSPPPLGDECRRLALPLSNELDDLRTIGTAGGLEMVLTESLPVREAARRRLVAVHVLRVEQDALLRPSSCRLQPADDVRTDAAEHRFVGVRVASMEVGGQGLSGQVVRDHTLRRSLEERQTLQPAEQLVRIRHFQCVAEQRLGGDPGQR